MGISVYTVDETAMLGAFEGNADILSTPYLSTRPRLELAARTASKSQAAGVRGVGRSWCLKYKS